MEAEEIRAIVPWRQPFLLIDRMVECTPHRSIVTEKRVTSGDPLLGTERPSEWFPGLLLLEGLGQTAALLFRLSYASSVREELPMLGFLKASLSGSARPGDLVRFEVEPARMTSRGGLFDGRARVGEAIVAEAQLAFMRSDAGGGART